MKPAWNTGQNKVGQNPDTNDNVKVSRSNRTKPLLLNFQFYVATNYNFHILFSFIFYDFYFFHYSKFTVFSQFLLYSKVTQSYIDSLFLTFSHFVLCRVLLQVTRYSSLCYTAGSLCLPTPNAIVCIY